MVARAQQGDHDAFRILVERYQGRAFALARRMLRSEEHARDAIQDAFLKAYTALPGFEGRSSFYTWLYRLVFNHCLDLKRKDKSLRHVEWQDERLGPDRIREEGTPGAIASGAFPSPGAVVERAELRELMATAIDQLPDDARETLLLRELDGLSYAEIAERLSIPKGTVMSRLFYARKKVQAMLIEAGVTPPASTKRARGARAADDGTDDEADDGGGDVADDTDDTDGDEDET
ncbi:MAG: sigma-70 family RNA polymerase sigma factor [Myxococcota bacterium]|nr:sigma-70 family RNA polymerase sigma factor [Myxococcales bacterium]